MSVSCGADRACRYNRVSSQFERQVLAKPPFRVVAMLFLLSFFTGCGQNTATGAGTGAVLGAGMGLLCGPLAPACAVAGATYGAAAGGVAGSIKDVQEQKGLDEASEWEEVR